MKENLVIIHGWGKKHSWERVVSQLENNFNIFLLDLPGFDFQIEKPYNFDDYIQFLESKINLNNYYLLGHSFGGALSLLYSLKHPEKIKKLILYNPAIIREENLKIKISQFLSQIFKKVKNKLPSKISYFIRKLYYRFFIKSYDYFLSDENLKETFRQIRKDLQEEARNLKVKTVLIWGKKDKITPLKHGKKLNQIIKDSTLVIVEGGHSFHKENPEKFCKVLTSYLK